ncbi:hypothetical protein BD410DRAFT_845689 [Rickenella mellea]|uniref:Uncharacterized protein n=1 Tax=Rickenella mellea TaxID=50990 RepID=A0A4Y7PHX0_9AGAM|nr:hypothetical protein BD410DRAFT_845689 [Rickenella mellea]
MSGSAHLRRRVTKLNPWMAFLHRRAKDVNKGGNPLLHFIKFLTEPVADRVLGDKENLRSISTSASEEYKNVSKADLRNMVAEYANYKQSVKNGVRVTSLSKAKDFAETVFRAEEQLKGLSSRTGAKFLILAVCGSTSFNAAPCLVATDQETWMFFTVCYNMDLMDILTKLEGYSIAGGKLSGAAGNYAKCVQVMKKECDITNETTIKMQYLTYHRNIVSKHRVVLRGWPFDKFRSPSQLSGSTPKVQSLLTALEGAGGNSPTCYWETIDDKEFEALDAEYERNVDQGLIDAPRERAVRKDAGKKRARRQQSASCKKRKSSTATPKSRETVSNADSESDDNSDSSSSSSESNKDDAEDAAN